MSNSNQNRWESIPLRLFLGIIFFFAGLDKITDPTFFDSKNANYIGAQLQGFVTYNHSPLSFLLTSIAIPNATIFGVLMALGEIACGLFAFIGLYTRAAAGLGLALSATLWLTASWGTQPFYTSWDLPYMFGWLTLLLLGAGRYSLDEQREAKQQLAPQQAQVNSERRRFLVQAGAAAGAVAALVIAGGEVFTGFASRNQSADITTVKQGATKAPNAGINNANAANPTAIPTADSGNVAIAPPTDTLAPAQSTDTPASAVPTDTPGQAAGPIAPAPPPTDTPAATDTPVPAAAPANGTLIAHTTDVPVGQGLHFTAPDTGDDSYIVHLSDGRFVGFDGICTHAGCTVQYDSQNTIFYCPCHGAEFDPTNNGAVLRRPARSPLAKLNISVDQASGSIYYLGQA